MTIGEIIAITISAIAAAGGLSGWAALRQNRELTARSDDIQARLAAVEEARRRDELRPRLTMVATRDGGQCVLTIRNGDRIDLDRVEIVEDVESPPVIARGIASATGPYRGLVIGEALRVAVPEERDQPGGRLVLRVRVTSGDDEWELAPTCEVDGSQTPRISVV